MPDLLTRLTGRQPTPQPLPEDRDLEQFFTDAEHARRLFEDLVRSAPLPKCLLVVHGVGGVGKSTLLKMYRLFCYRHHVPVALVGAEDAPSSVDVLANWADDLSSMGVRLRAFPGTLAHYRALQAKVETKARKAGEVMKGAAGELGKAAAKTAVEMAASAIPVVGPLAAALGGAGTEAAIDWLRGFLSRPDLELYLDPSERLAGDFLSDLARASAHQRIVLMVDTYEQMTALDEWMRDLARHLPGDVLLVISGRLVPEWDRAWPAWMGRAEIVELQEMSPDDLRTLVNRYYAYVRGGEPDPEQVQAIVKFARGLPIAAATVVQLWVKHGVEDFHAVKPQVVADLADRLLEGVPPEIRPVFGVAAVLRYFNAGSLQALLGEDDAEELYDELRRWPFIRPRREGLAVHDTMREVINEALRARGPGGFQALHRRAAAYYAECLGGATGDERERLALERLYHNICADEVRGMCLFQEMAEELARYRLVNHLRALLNDVGTYNLEYENSHLWLKYYSARLAHLELRLDDAESAYKDIGDSQAVEPKLRAYALCNLGFILARWQRLGRPGGIEKAIDVFEQSLSLAPLDAHLVEGLIGLSHVYRYQSKWDRVVTSIDKVIRFFMQRGDEYGLVNAYGDKKTYHAYRGEWKEMFAAHELGAQVPSASAESHYARKVFWGESSWAWVLAGRYVEVEKILRKGRTIAYQRDDARSVCWFSMNLGFALAMQNRYQEATKCCVESLKSRRILGEYYGTYEARIKSFRGVLLTRQGRWEAAEDELTGSRAIREELQLDIGIAEVWVWLGRLYEAKREWGVALDWYGRCLETRWIGRRNLDCAALAGTCRAKYQLGEFAQVLLYFGEAEKLAQQYEYNDQLASLRLLQGHSASEGHIAEWRSGFEAALNYYQQALIHALRYNRFLLDEVLWGGEIITSLCPIVSHCLTRGEVGRQMLTALRDWWQSGVNDIGTPRPGTISLIPEGIPLLEAERFAREREPGDGSPQTTVIDRIEQALK